MRIPAAHILKLKQLLKEQFGKDLTDEEAQEAGRAIMRFVVAKQRRGTLNKDGDGYVRDELGSKENI